MLSAAKHPDTVSDTGSDGNFDQDISIRNFLTVVLGRTLLGCFAFPPQQRQKRPVAGAPATLSMTRSKRNCWW